MLRGGFSHMPTPSESAWGMRAGIYWAHTRPDTRVSVLHAFSYLILTTKCYPEEEVYSPGMQLVSGRIRTCCRPGSKAGVLGCYRSFLLTDSTGEGLWLVDFLFFRINGMDVFYRLISVLMAKLICIIHLPYKSYSSKLRNVCIEHRPI